MTWHSLLHGPEAWMGIAIWAIGAFCGVAASWAAIEISDRREKRESAASDMDHTGQRERGASPGRADPGERGGQG